MSYKSHSGLIVQNFQACATDHLHGEIIAARCHLEAQLLHAISGVMTITADMGSWVVPTGHALWMSAGVSHEIRMGGSVQMRSLFIAASPGILEYQHCQVIEVSMLLRELIIGSPQVIRSFKPTSRDEHLLALTIAELGRAPIVGIHMPMPSDKRLKGLCLAFLDSPADIRTLDEWAVALNMFTYVGEAFST